MRGESRFRAISPTLSVITIVIAALSIGAVGRAAVLTFDNFQHVGSDDIDYIVTVKDDSEAGVSPGHFKFTYQVAPLSDFTVGKLTGFFFDAADPFVANNSPYNSGNLGLQNEFNPSSSSICGQGFNTDQVSGAMGCNSTLNLGAGAGSFQNHQFDAGLAWKVNDLSGGGMGMFEVADLGLDLTDIVAIGLRGQDTTGEGGSAKEFQLYTTTPVPEPSTMFLLGSGLIGLGIVGLRRRRTQ